MLVARKRWVESVCFPFRDALPDLAVAAIAAIEQMRFIARLQDAAPFFNIMSQHGCFTTGEDEFPYQEMSSKKELSSVMGATHPHAFMCWAGSAGEVQSIQQ